MQVKHESIGGRTVVRIEGPLCIFSAAAVWVEVEAVRNACSEALTLDLSGVDECDAAGAQLICGLVRNIRSGGRAIDCMSAGDAVTRVFNQSGLDPDILIPGSEGE